MMMILRVEPGKISIEEDKRVEREVGLEAEEETNFSVVGRERSRQSKAGS